MAALPYMPLYVADYLADAAHLSAAGHGAYLLLIMNYWQRGEALPDDERKLMRIARMTPDEWADVCDDIREFFDINAGVWKHKRIEAELAKVSAKSEQARSAGKARAKQAASARSTSAQRPLSHTDTDTESKTSPKGESKSKGANTPSVGKADVRSAVEMWNAMAKAESLPAVQRLTSQRRTKLVARLATYGLAAWLQAVDRIRGSPGLLGRADGSWRANFDWLLRPNTIAKILEGQYDNWTNDPSKTAVDRFLNGPEDGDERGSLRGGSEADDGPPESPGGPVH